MIISEDVASKLLQIKAIQLRPQNPFTWASGLLSPIYCDNRLLLSYPVVRDRIVSAFVEATILYSPFNTVAGVATAGIAHGALLADRLKMPFVYVRSKRKAHGRQNLIEGKLPSDAICLVIEDLVSTGKSCLAAVEALRAAGARVIGVCSVFQYDMEAARLAFLEAECPFQSLTDLNTLLRVAISEGYINEDDAQLLAEWSADPAAWAKRAVT